MTNRKVLWTYFNVDTGQLVDASNVPISNLTYPVICFKEYPVMCLSLYTGFAQGVVVPYTGFSELMTFTAAVDTDFDHDTDLMIKSRFAADVNIPGDWESANISQGRLSIRLNANTLGFQTKIGSTPVLEAYFELQGFVSTLIEGVPQIVLASVTRLPVLVKNTIDDSEGTTPLPTDPLSGYYPYWTVDALLAAKSDRFHTASEHGDLRWDMLGATGTDFAYEAGRVQVGETVIDVPAGTISSLTAAGTYYLEVDQSGAVSENTVGFSRGSMPLYEIASNGAVLTPVDRRAWLNLTPTENIGDLKNVSKLQLETGSALTVSSGVVTATGVMHTVTPETGITDDITAVTMTAGMMCLLVPASASYSLTLKYSASLVTPDLQDYVIPAAGVLLFRHSTVTRVLTESKPRLGLLDSVNIPAAAFIAATGDSGPRYARLDTPVNRVNQDVYWFAGSTVTADQTLWSGIELPDSWNKGPVKAFAKWLSPSGSTAGQAVDFTLASRAINSGESMDQTMGTAVTAHGSITAADREHGTLFGGYMTPAGTPQSRSMVILKLQRAYGVGATGEAGFLGLSLQFQETTTDPIAWV